jgi:hypothetical protein
MVRLRNGFSDRNVPGAIGSYYAARLRGLSGTGIGVGEFLYYSRHVIHLTYAKPESTPG